MTQWEKHEAANGQEYYEAVINGRTARICCCKDDQRTWHEMDVDGCTMRSQYVSFQEAAEEAHKLANRTVAVKVITLNQPQIETREGLSGWGDNSHCTTLQGDVGEIEIHVTEQERYSLRVEEGRVILTCYGKPLHMTLPTNLYLETRP